MSSTTTDFVIACGTYEQLIYGFDVSLEQLDAARDDTPVGADKAEIAELQTSFATPAHTGSIRAIGANSRYLVSGSTDETLRLFNLHQRREIGVVHHHSGAIEAIEFFGVHMLVASQDGTVSIWRTKDWELHGILGTKKKAPMLDLSVHPSGRALLTVGKDRRLKMWNLLTTELVYKKKFAAESTRVCWSPDGSHYALVQAANTLVFDAANELCHTLQSDELPLHDVAFSPNSRLVAIGGESKLLDVFSVKSGKRVCRAAGHRRRIKSVRFITDSYAVSVCSMGDIRVWHIDAKAKQIKCIGMAELDVRLNCIAVTQSKVAKWLNLPDGDGDGDDDDDDGDDDGERIGDYGDEDGDDDSIDERQLAAELAAEEAEEAAAALHDDDDDDEGDSDDDNDDDDDEEDSGEFARAIKSGFKDYLKEASDAVSGAIVASKASSSKRRRADADADTDNGDDAADNDAQDESGDDSEEMDAAAQKALRKQRRKKKAKEIKRKKQKQKAKKAKKDEE